MLLLHQPEWEPVLLEILDKPIASLRTEHMAAIVDQVFWQTVAAEVLGKRRSPAAVRPLIKVVLSPFKVNMHTAALRGLIRIGLPAVEPAAKLLSNADSELVRYATAESLRRVVDGDSTVNNEHRQAARTAHRKTAAIMLGSIGRRECVAPMLKALSKSNATTQAIIARELPKLPGKEVVEAFKRIWAKTSLTQTIPPAGHAKEALTGVATSFFDPELASWIASRALALKGPEVDVAPIQDVAFVLLMKLAGKKQLPLLDKLAAIPINYPKKTTIGAGWQRELGLTKELVKRCDDDMDCYLKRIASPKTKSGQDFGAIKAAYSAAAIGGPAGRHKLVAALRTTDNDAVIYVLGAAIDRLTPDGGTAMATALEALVDEAHASGNKRKIQSRVPLDVVAARLRSRAE